MDLLGLKNSLIKEKPRMINPRFSALKDKRPVRPSPHLSIKPSYSSPSLPHPRSSRSCSALRLRLQRGSGTLSCSFRTVRVPWGIAEHELAHHAVGGEFVEVTAAKVGELVVVRGLHDFDCLVELRVHGLSAGLAAPVFGGHFARFQFLEHLAVGSGVDVREGGNRLQLRRAFVNRSNTSVAVETLTGVFEHVAGTAVNLDAVVGVQVGVFGVLALRKRRASRSEFLVELEFRLLLVGELAGAFDVLEALVDVHVAGYLVQECAACVEACLDVRNHLVDGGEVHDDLAELLAVLGVGESFVVSHLADAHGLCCNAEACTVHEGHHVLDETELAAATEFSSHTTVRLMPHSRLHGSLR